jgi:hypothetical protein
MQAYLARRLLALVPALFFASLIVFVIVRLIAGIAIVILALAALAAFAVWEEWLNLVVGLWTLVSPWVLGFQGTAAMTVHVVIGAAVALLAAIELWIMFQNPPRLTTHS